MSAQSSVSRMVADTPWPWLAALAALSCLSLGTYTGIQQTLRGGANDPQVQLAEDAAARLAGGEAPEAVVPAARVDASRSLSPWIAVARADGSVLAASGELDGGAPAPPAGVLTSAVRDGGNRVTWQPGRGVRIALVVVPVRGRSDLVVMAGRSLREVEERVDRTGRLCLLSWAAAIGVVACAWGLAAWGRLAAQSG